MVETFGDFLKRTTEGSIGGDEEIVPADECDILDRFAKTDGVTREEEIKRLSNKLLEIRFPEGFDDGYILGDEAEYAICENCQVSIQRNDGVECEGCGTFFGKHGKGRNHCWRSHNCGVLVTSEGRKVALNDKLVYPSHHDEYEVVEMAPTWVKGGHARGRRNRGAHEMPIVPRLMLHKN